MRRQPKIHQLLWNVYERHRLFHAAPSPTRAAELAEAEAEVDKAISDESNCDDLDTTPLHSADEIPY